MTGTWTKLTGVTGLTGRDTAQLIKHDGAHLIWSGYYYNIGTGQTGVYRDLLLGYSPTAWQTVAATAVPAPYSPISSEGNWLYAIDTKVRRTTDYVNWEIVAASIPFTLLDGSGNGSDALRIHKMGTRRLILLPSGDIWHTTDWINWTQATTPIGQRFGAISIVYDGKLMVMGGAVLATNIPPEQGYSWFTSCTDVWSSSDPTDPTSWKCSEPPYDPRMWPAVGEHDGVLYLTGGYSDQRGNSFNFSTMFRYTHADGWDLVPVTAAFTPVHGHTLMSDDGSLYQLCGSNNPNGTIAEVWRFSA